MTTTNTPTPGPWQYRLNDCLQHTAQADGLWVALATSEADARLIAAAPEMLDALRDLLKQMDQWKQKKGAGSIEYWAGPGQQAARSAIAKATE